MLYVLYYYMILLIYYYLCYIYFIYIYLDYDSGISEKNLYFSTCSRSFLKGL